MKRIYLSPAIRLREVDLDELLQDASLPFGNDPEEGVEGDAKPLPRYSVWDDDNTVWGR